MSNSYLVVICRDINKKGINPTRYDPRNKFDNINFNCKLETLEASLRKQEHVLFFSHCIISVQKRELTDSMLSYLYLDSPQSYHFFYQCIFSFLSPKKESINLCPIFWKYSSISNKNLVFKSKYLVFQIKTQYLNRNTQYFKRNVLVFQKRCEIPGFSWILYVFSSIGFRSSLRIRRSLSKYTPAQFDK